MRQAKEDTFLVFRAKCRRMDLPMDFFTDITGYVKAVLWGTPSPVVSSAILSLTFRRQDAIGPGMLLRGFIAKGWAVALMGLNKHLPHQTMARLLQIIWDDICPCVDN